MNVLCKYIGQFQIWKACQNLSLIQNVYSGGYYTKSVIFLNGKCDKQKYCSKLSWMYYLQYFDKKHQPERSRTHKNNEQILKLTRYCFGRSWQNKKRKNPVRQFRLNFCFNFVHGISIIFQVRYIKSHSKVQE